MCERGCVCKTGVTSTLGHFLSLWASPVSLRWVPSTAYPGDLGEKCVCVCVCVCLKWVFAGPGRVLIHVWWAPSTTHPGDHTHTHTHTHTQGIQGAWRYGGEEKNTHMKEWNREIEREIDIERKRDIERERDRERKRERERERWKTSPCSAVQRAINTQPAKKTKHRSYQELF